MNTDGNRSVPRSSEPISPQYTPHPSTGGEIVTSQGILSWLLDAKAEGATHLIVVCDTYDWSDYPVSVMPNEDVRQVQKELHESNMQRVMEVYWLDGDLEAQLAMDRSFTYGPPSPEE